jgi:maltose alpha-D-glucosyltransferase/alpha-amylase
LKNQPPPPDLQGIPGFDPAGMKRIGERTAELHAALSSVSDDPAFATQDCTAYYKRSLFQSLRSIASRSFQRLSRLSRRLPAEDRETVERFLEREPAIMQVFQQLLESELNFQRIRCHGNYGLHSLLFTGNDYMIYDFRGNVEQSVGERRLKRPALRDVAGMIWSLESAAETALTAQEQSGKERAALQRWEDRWFRWSAAAFLDGYFTTAAEAAFLPAKREESRTLLKAELFRLSLGDLAWELDHTGQISPDVIVGLDRLFRTT